MALSDEQLKELINYANDSLLPSDEKRGKGSSDLRLLANVLNMVDLSITSLRNQVTDEECRNIVERALSDILQDKRKARKAEPFSAARIQRQA